MQPATVEKGHPEDYLVHWFRLADQCVEGRHLSPSAEGFQAAFNLGGDGNSIASLDADGGVLAAIKGFSKKLEAENAALRADPDRKAVAFVARNAPFQNRPRTPEAAR